MRKSVPLIPALAASLAFTLSACGGDDTGSPAAPSPAPSPSPSPSPTPTPSPTPAPYYALPGAFGALGQTTPQTFALLAVRTPANLAGWDFLRDYEAAELGPLATLRLGTGDQLFLTLPGRAEVKVPEGQIGYYALDGRITGMSYNVLGGTLQFSTPVKPGGTAYYAWVGRGSWLSAGEGTGQYPYDFVEFVYGIPTPATAVPASGIRRYRAESEFINDIDIDFATGRVTGNIVMSGGTRAFRFDNVVLTPDRTGFGGTLVDPDTGVTGTIEGRLAGPNGDEFFAIAKLVNFGGPYTLTFVGSRI